MRRTSIAIALLLAVVVPTRIFANSVADDRKLAESIAQQDCDLGKRAVLNGRFSQAIEAFDDALTIDPKLAKAHDGRGVALALLNRLSEAEAAFREAIRLESSFAEPHFNLGKLLLDGGRVADARAQLQTAVALNPKHLESNELLIDAVLILGDPVSAAKLVTALDQNHVVHPAQWHIDVGDALRKFGDPAAARHQYQLVFNDDPTPSERREAELALSRLRR